MRQTSLTFEELSAEIDKPFPIDKRCLFLNEIGCILWEGGEETKKAESFLRGLLSSDDSNDQFYALCYLTTTKTIDEETTLGLEEFKTNPANQELVEKAKKATYRWQFEEAAVTN